ncbi:MAG: hypothetical protein OEN56_02405 [Gemmatimonadota bacterium]|nr:hypothetical protein [Gemmatimonadota bacterium]
MSEKKTIGAILMGLGRISEDDITTALDYQREHGGYFGEALVACGLVSEEELEWGLASQFDLPYVFPEAEAVDLEAASLVSPEWALTHLVLPIVKTDSTLQVVVDSPLKEGPIGELQKKTDLDIELALASPNAIREVIRQVFARAAALQDEETAPLSLENTLELIFDAEAPRWGISVRGARAHAWWDEGGGIHRRPLDGNWLSTLEEVLVPPPSQVATDSRRFGWDAGVSRSGDVAPVGVECLTDESGCEYLFVARDLQPALEERFTPPPEGIVSEIRILARTGTARFAVTTDPPQLGHEILPHLPALTLEPLARGIYLSAREEPAGTGTFSVTLPPDPSTWEREIEALRAFRFDVVTVDLSSGDSAWASSALDVASVAFLLWSDADLEPARQAGVRWRLHIERGDGRELRWSLESLTE